MTHYDLVFLCKSFNLGTPTQEAYRVYGGLLHKMWRVDTEKGSYAIKQLSEDIDLKNAKIIKNYELSECIAARFINAGIPAISAMKKNGQHLFIKDHDGFLVYPWVDAKALEGSTVLEKHAFKIAVLLAKMHGFHFDDSAMDEAEFFTLPRQEMLELFDKAGHSACSFSADFQKNKTTLLDINEAYQAVIPLLKTHGIISHGDLDQKNVLWDADDHPILIDWESARKVNPTYEIVNVALDWSGITQDFNMDLFLKMLLTYQKAGGVIDKSMIEPALYGVVGNWMHWLTYNIKRAIDSDDQEQKQMGILQVNQTLATILRVKNLIPEFMNRGAV